MEKKKPTGFVAVCQCGVSIGAMVFTRTDRKEAGKIISDWLMDGCTVSPRFTGSWSEKLGVCECDQKPAPEAKPFVCRREMLTGRRCATRCGESCSEISPRV